MARAANPLPRSFLSILLSLLLTSMAAGAPSATDPGPSAEALIEAGLRHLHQGRYAEAEAAFDGAVRAAPQDPETHLFEAFAHWWLIVFDETMEGAHDQAFDTAIDATLVAGDRLLERHGGAGDARALAANGTAHILRSHVEALRRHHMRAATEARRGRRMLLDALELQPDLTEALFPLGAFNYYADKVPAIVKGLRVILFLPGGDAELGLRQLNRVAGASDRFTTDARLLLAAICGDRDEAAYDAARAHLEAALEDNPGSPLILAPIAELDMRLGRHADAVHVYEDAMRGSAGGGPDRLRQRAWLHSALAAALMADWRLEEAAAALQPAVLASRDDPSGSLRKSVQRLRLELALRRGEKPAWDAILGTPATGGPAPGAGAATAAVSGGLEDAVADALRAARLHHEDEAVTILQRSRAAHPGNPLPPYLAGQILFRIGRHREAVDLFGEVLGAHQRLPPWMEGWAAYYRGMAFRTIGRESDAMVDLRRASEVRRFRAADLAVLELRGGSPGNPACGPAPAAVNAVSP